MNTIYSLVEKNSYISIRHNNFTYILNIDIDSNDLSYFFYDTYIYSAQDNLYSITKIPCRNDQGNSTLIFV